MAGNTEANKRAETMTHTVILCPNCGRTYCAPPVCFNVACDCGRVYRPSSASWYQPLPPSPEPCNQPANESAAGPDHGHPDRAAGSLLDLAELRRLEREAIEQTPGPWRQDQRLADCILLGQGVETWQAALPSQQDAALIVAMRNSLPALLDELEYVRDKVERLLNVARGCHDFNGGHHEKSAHAIYHHGIQTVINALECAAVDNLNDFQVNVLESIGRASVTGNPEPMPTGEDVGGVLDIALTDRATKAARTHLLDAIDAAAQENGQPMQHVRAALAALEGEESTV